MPAELRVPPVGESITEVLIGEWLKVEGDSVQLDEVIAKLETDKVTVELPSPVAGRLVAILVAQGKTAKVGDVIGLLEEGAQSAVEPRPVVKGEASRPAPPIPSTPAQRPGAAPNVATSGLVATVEQRMAPSVAGGARVMPSARRALHEHGLDAEGVAGSGAGGRMLKEDVLRAAEALRKRPLGPVPNQANAEATERFEDIVPMSPFRRRIAERLVEAQHSAALLTTFNEVDMSAVLALRKEYQDEFHEKYGIKLGFMSFFVKATVEALKQIPAVNAEIRGNDIVYKNFYDIGIAVGGGKGLVVPVVRGADRLSFAELEQTISDLGKRAKESKIELHELTGGTFTISNGGVYGSLLSTPIVNPPQSGILGLHAMQDRPIAANGQVVIRPMMYIALTYDHRLIDGRDAVTFLKRIKQCVEQPTRILLEI